jgi:hypothetical protein
MAKYYIKCGTLELIKSSNKDISSVAMEALWELNDNDILDEYFYIDERGFRDYITAEPDTAVLSSVSILKKAGWTLS